MDKQVSTNQITRLNNFLESDSSDIDAFFLIEQVGTKNNNITIENEIMEMQLDTTLAISAISLLHYENKFKSLPIVKINLNLKSYLDENITSVGHYKYDNK